MLIRDKAESLILMPYWDPAMPDPKKMSEHIPLFARYLAKKLLTEIPVNKLTKNARISNDTLTFGIIALIHECHQSQGKSICWKSSLAIEKRWQISHNAWYKMLKYLTITGHIQRDTIKGGSCTLPDGSLLKFDRTVIAFTNKMGDEFDSWYAERNVSKKEKGVPSISIGIETPKATSGFTMGPDVVVSEEYYEPEEINE